MHAVHRSAPLCTAARRMTTLSTHYQCRRFAAMSPLAISPPGAAADSPRQVVFGGDRDTLVLFHLPYGGQVLFNNLERTARVLQGANVRVVTFSSYKNSFDSAKFLNLPERSDHTRPPVMCLWHVRC
jgi:hypothetical protein